MAAALFTTTALIILNRLLTQDLSGAFTGRSPFINYRPMIDAIFLVTWDGTIFDMFLRRRLIIALPENVRLFF